jgi:UDP-N-acetylmuramyl pentapeptide phosphotransferase/UDP-N-acetylglucosamine-1-phosphate transferase
MEYIITTILLVISLYIYFPIAQKRNMLAGVNHRSSHTKPVITGAGFIFFFSYIAYAICLWLNPQAVFPWPLFVGLTMLSVISFVDDLEEVWFLWRLIAQVLGILLMLWQIGIVLPQIVDLESATFWIVGVVCLGLMVGLLNMFNFMDGLNGMLGSLVIASLIPLWLINNYVTPFVDNQLIYFTAIPTLIFMFFNARKQAVCFSGDVGAIAVGFVMSYLVLLLVLQTGNVVFFAFFVMIFIEAGLTIIQRLFAGENIFKPHRIHLFQLLCNEGKRNHVLVSCCYGLIQLAVGLLIVAMNYYQMPQMYQHLLVWPIVGVLALTYLLYKRKKLGGHLLGYKEYLNKRPE